MRTQYPSARLEFIIGDVRHLSRVEEALQDIDIVVHAAAMKRVETCEEHPAEASAINIGGAVNIVSAIRRFRLPVSVVVGVSSDKGCCPLNVYGATKLIQEKVLLEGNHTYPAARWVAVCYGNVLASRGSMVPMFKAQIARGGPVRVNDPAMTRFLLSLDQAVDAVLTAIADAKPGEVYVPILPAARVGDVASVLINGADVATEVVGHGRWEKKDETLIIAQDADKVERRGDYYVVTQERQRDPVLFGEYVSSDHLLTWEQLARLFVDQGHIEEVKV